MRQNPVMGAHLAVDDLPFTIHFENVSAAALTPMIAKWIEAGTVMRIGTPEDEEAGEGTHILVNFGLVKYASVTDTRLGDDQVITFSADLSLLQDM